MAKRISKECYIRNLTEVDNQMLEKLRNLTGTGHNSQAFLRGGALALKQVAEIDDMRRYIAELEGKINKFEDYGRDLFISLEGLKMLSKG